MWRKNSKGTKYRGLYVTNTKGQRTFCLVGLLKNGKPHCVTASSPEAMKTQGWTTR